MIEFTSIMIIALGYYVVGAIAGSFRSWFIFFAAFTFCLIFFMEMMENIEQIEFKIINKVTECENELDTHCDGFIEEK